MKQFSGVISHDLQWENKKHAFGGWGWGEVSGVSFPLPRELGTKLKKSHVISSDFILVSVFP